MESRLILRFRPGNDDGANNGGIIYMFTGVSALSGDYDAATTNDVEVYGDSPAINAGERLTVADMDGDGYGDPLVTTLACTEPSGYIADNADCDDSASTTFPGAEEVCNDGIDSDCAGNDDYDADGDGHASDEFAGDDCDDEDPTHVVGDGGARCS